MATPSSYKQTFGDIMVNMVQWRECTEHDTTTGCINWTGNSWHSQGYGFVMVWDAYTGKKKMATTHRVAMKQINPNITRKDFVIHSCCNPRCVNPLHLILGNNSGDSVIAKKAAGKWVKRESKYAHRQSQLTRVYMYTVEQLIYCKHHTNKETVEHFNTTLKDVNQMRDYLHPVRGFKWLKLIEDKYDTMGKLKPGCVAELAVEFQLKGKR